MLDKNPTNGDQWKEVPAGIETHIFWEDLLCFTSTAASSVTGPYSRREGQLYSLE